VSHSYRSQVSPLRNIKADKLAEGGGVPSPPFTVPIRRHIQRIGGQGNARRTSSDRLQRSLRSLYQGTTITGGYEWR
jgi:hypothetical protein